MSERHFIIKKLTELELKNKRVFLRVDFNVPLKDDGNGALVVSDPKRIEAALETIRYIVQNEGKCIIASHLGRPKGKPSKKYSLEPVAAKLSEYLDKDVILTEDCIGDGPKALAQQMRPGEVMMLENLRFHDGEEGNAPDFANRLFEMTDVYVTDAFGTLHRAHASTYALPKFVENRAVGFLVQKELDYLKPLKEDPKRPFLLIMGGAKVTDKIAILEAFMPKANKVFIGGAMAYAFLKAQGKTIGTSLCDDKQVQLATKILRGAEARGVKILLPVDHLITQKFEDTKNTRVTTDANIPEGWMGVDVGPKTLNMFTDELNGIETVFWNGPVGVFEVPEFAGGTNGLAEVVANSSAKKLAGGGDVAAAIANAGFEGRFDFISTGGGATLEYLEGKELPGLKALEIEIREDL